jgi:hypothetical protein
VISEKLLKTEWKLTEKVVAENVEIRAENGSENRRKKESEKLQKESKVRR